MLVQASRREGSIVGFTGEPGDVRCAQMGNPLIHLDKWSALEVNIKVGVPVRCLWSAGLVRLFVVGIVAPSRG